VQQRWALLGFLTGRGQLEELRAQFFRAGHAHSGVLLVLSFVYFLYLDRNEYSIAVQWLAGLLLAALIILAVGLLQEMSKQEEGPQ
jgi:putative effector of murein hydrolase